MTPELPRAPRSMAEAVMEAAFSRVGSSAFFRSATAAFMVMDYVGARVAVGHGKDVGSLIDCLWISIERPR